MGSKFYSPEPQILGRNGFKKYAGANKRDIC